MSIYSDPLLTIVNKVSVSKMLYTAIKTYKTALCLIIRETKQTGHQGYNNAPKKVHKFMFCIPLKQRYNKEPLGY